MPRVVFACLIMAVGLYGGLGLSGDWFSGIETTRIAALGILIAGGLAIFASAALILRAVQFSDFSALRRSR
jgi:hypothetical protein